MDAAVAEFEELAELQDAEIQARAIELEARDRRVEELERVATRLSERVVEGENEVRRLRAELARVLSEGEAKLATMTALLGELEDVRRSARGQATRIRLGALREAAELSERVAELTQRPGGLRERLLEALTEAIARIGGEGDGAALAEPNGHGEAEEATELFEGMVRLEIGPLQDFAQLVGFEDAAKSIEGASRISVTRFSEGRATLELSLTEPVELLRELEQRCDLAFVIRDLREDRVVLDVGE